MESLIDGDIVAPLCHISGKSQPGRTAPHHSHFDAVSRGTFGSNTGAVFALIVGSEAFEVTDSHSGTTHLVVDTLALTLLFLRAYPTTHCGQCGGGFQGHCRSVEVAALDIFDKGRDFDAYRTTGDTLRIRAIQTAGGFFHSHLGSKTLVYLLIAGDAIVGSQLGHFHTLYSCALLGRHFFSQLLAPLSGTVSLTYILIFHVVTAFIYYHCRRRANASSSRRNPLDGRQIRVRRYTQTWCVRPR